MSVPGEYAVAPPGAALRCSDAKHGKPVRHYTYVNAEGEALVHVDYYDAPPDAPLITGEATMPVYRTWDAAKGHWEKRRGAPTPTILYRLNEIKPGPLVVICSTEREADWIAKLVADDPLSEPVIPTTWLGQKDKAPHLDVGPLSDSPVMLLCSLDALDAFTALAARLWNRGIKGSKVVPARDVPGTMTDWTPLSVDSLTDLWRILGYGSYITEAPPEPKTARPVGPVGSVHVAKLPMVERWRAWHFEVNGQHRPYMSTANAKKFLDHHPEDEGCVWLDLYRQQLRFGVWNGHHREWSDADDAALQVKLQTEAGLYTISKQHVRDAVLVRAQENPIHPYRAMRKAVKWDGVERMSRAFVEGWGCPDDEYHIRLSEGFFIQQALRIMHPGCKADIMVMFEGPTNIGKTSALSIVFGADNVTSPTAQFGTQKFYEEIQGKAVVEIADLHCFQGAALDAIKAGVTRTTDRFRPAYGRYAEDFKRQCVIVGTTESSDWNDDPMVTARRFPPAECTKVNFDWLRLNAEQILAEAWYKASQIPEEVAMSGAYWNLPAETAREKQFARAKSDMFESVIEHYLENVSEVTMLDIARDALNITDMTKMDQRLNKRLTTILRKLGWLNVRTKTLRYWRRGPYAKPRKSEF